MRCLGDLLPELRAQRGIGGHLGQQRLETFDRLTWLAGLHGGYGEVVSGDPTAGIGFQ